MRSTRHLFVHTYTPQVLPAWLCCDVYVPASASRIHWAPPCHWDAAMATEPSHEAVFYSKPVYTSVTAHRSENRASSVRVRQEERGLSRYEAVANTRTPQESSRAGAGSKQQLSFQVDFKVNTVDQLELTINTCCASTSRCRGQSCIVLFVNVLTARWSLSLSVMCPWLLGKSLLQSAS